MTSVVSLRAVANSATVSPLVLADMKQEHLAEPRLLALSGADAALVNCRKDLNHVRPMGLPAVFMRLVGETVLLNCAAPFIRRIEGFEPCRNEMIIERGGPPYYSREPFAAFASATHALDEMSADDVHRAVSTISDVYADVCDSAEWIAATTPQRLGNGKQANGMSAGG
jgi:hypothetical protein